MTSEFDLEIYKREGFFSPLRAMSEDEAAQQRRELEMLEADAASDPEKGAVLKNSANWVLPWFDRVARTPAIIDSVSRILGPDVLALSVDLFIKEPRTADFISWHQDLHYWGLSASDEVTAWLALSPVTQASGCMRFIPRSHTKAVEHVDQGGADNMLSRGQAVAVDIDEDRAFNNELAPGEFSLHHGRLFHASHANGSDDRRIGLALRYVSPAMARASAGPRMGASLVAGTDRFGHFELVPPPQQNYAVSALDRWQRLRAVSKAVHLS